MTKAAVIAKHLLSSQKTLATAESCTGGLIAHTLTNIPGSSTWFTGGIIAYANRIKTALLGVPSALLKKHGAVSAPVAKAMAQGARKRLKTSFAIATTGIAGPTGATPGKPVGLVFISVASSQKTITRRFIFKGSRSRIKKQAANKALSMFVALHKK
jgi:PncC family amidohydrolase